MGFGAWREFGASLARLNPKDALRLRLRGQKTSSTTPKKIYFSIGGGTLDIEGIPAWRLRRSGALSGVFRAKTWFFGFFGTTPRNKGGIGRPKPRQAKPCGPKSGAVMVDVILHYARTVAICHGGAE